jgi:hypothetical protein
MDSSFKVLVPDGEFNPNKIKSTPSNDENDRASRIKQILGGNLEDVTGINNSSNHMFNPNVQEDPRMNYSYRPQPPDSIMNRLNNVNLKQNGARDYGNQYTNPNVNYNSNGFNMHNDNSNFNTEYKPNYIQNHNLNFNGEYKPNYMQNHNSNSFDNVETGSNYMRNQFNSQPSDNFETRSNGDALMNMLNHGMESNKSRSNSRRSRRSRFNNFPQQRRPKERSNKYRTRSRRSKRSRTRMGLYEQYMSDNESEADYRQKSRRGESNEMFTSEQRKLIMDKITEYCPETMADMINDDIMNSMERLQEKGYSLPAGYDKSKHDIRENEIHLYNQQQSQLNEVGRKKVAGLLNIAAEGGKWFCKMSNIEMFKADLLPEEIKRNIELGNFDEVLDGIAKSIKGTCFDDPVVAGLITFCVIGMDAHQKQIEKEEQRADEEEEKQEDLHHKNLSNFRQRAPPKHQSKNNNLMSSSSTVYNLPKPSTLVASSGKKKTP